MPTINKPRKRTKRTDDAYEGRRKIYQSARWRRLRALKIANNPLCEMCLKEGRTTPAEDVHHIISFLTTDDEFKRKALAYDYDNLMSLCKECHSRIHGKEGRTK